MIAREAHCFRRQRRHRRVQSGRRRQQAATSRRAGGCGADRSARASSCSAAHLLRAEPPPGVRGSVGADRRGGGAPHRAGAEADLLVVAPATANTIARLAHGIADDMLAAVALATTAPLLLVARNGAPHVRAPGDAGEPARCCEERGAMICRRRSAIGVGRGGRGALPRDGDHSGAHPARSRDAGAIWRAGTWW